LTKSVNIAYQALWSTCEEVCRSLNKGWEEVVKALMSFEENDQRTLAHVVKDKATSTNYSYATVKLQFCV
jgi:hypothetical protein